MRDYDVIIMGAGPAGSTLAKAPGREGIQGYASLKRRK